jgi:molybdopterin-guanine dinucleotide biosynthesis protein A
VCVLPASVQSLIQQALEQPVIPRVVEVLERAGVGGVMFEEEWPFVNVNTPEELARLAALF